MNIQKGQLILNLLRYNTKKATANDIDFAIFVYDHFKFLHDQCKTMSEIKDVKELKQYYDKVFLPYRLHYIENLYLWFKYVCHSEEETGLHQSELLVTGFEGGDLSSDLSYKNPYKILPVCQLFIDDFFNDEIECFSDRGIETIRDSMFDDYNPSKYIEMKKKKYADFTKSFYVMIKQMKAKKKDEHPKKKHNNTNRKVYTV